MPRRRAGTLLPLESAILDAGLRLGRDGDRFHGFGLAAELAGHGAKRLISHGTLYKALARLLDAGFVHAVWEDPAIAAEAKRPRRRLYEVTPAGAAALELSRSATSDVQEIVWNPQTAGGAA